MVRVLHEMSALDGGGVAKLVYDYYKHMDHSQVHFDFLIYDFYEEGMYEAPLREMGCTIYKLPRFKKDKMGYFKGMAKVIREGNYDVIHSHMGSRGLFAMIFGKKYGVPTRIVHSHIAYEPVSGWKKKLNHVLAKIAKANATNLFACGKDAGKYMWGENANVHIMTNAVDTEGFQFDPVLREEKRRELGLEGKFVYGIVGRLSEQKNYPFLFDAYEKVIQTLDNTVLVIVGRGLEEEAIKELARKKGIADSVMFLGLRDDVPKLLNAFDLFVLPSRYEGLPVVLIEAQANGLPELVSDKVTREMDVSDLIAFLPIDKGADIWAEEMSRVLVNTEQRAAYSHIIADAGYDIKKEAQRMQDYYIKKGKRR